MANNLSVKYSTIVSNTNYDLVSSYVPSAELKSRLRADISSFSANFNSFISIYNNWNNGLMNCDWSAVRELEQFSSCLLWSINSIKNNCHNDINNEGLPQALTVTEQKELNSLIGKISPLELLAILKSNIH